MIIHKVIYRCGLSFQELLVLLFPLLNVREAVRQKLQMLCMTSSLLPGGGLEIFVIVIIFAIGVESLMIKRNHTMNLHPHLDPLASHSNARQQCVESCMWIEA